MRLKGIKLDPSQPKVVRCPACRYDLAGLPERHRCPECGLEYDKSMQVFRPSPEIVGISLTGIFVCLVIVGFCAWFVDSTPGGGGGWLGPALVMGVLTVLFIFGVLRGRRSAAILSLQGVTFIGPEGGPRHFPWSIVGEVKFSRIDGKVYVRDLQGETLRAIPYAFFGQYGTAKKFAAAAQVWLARARQGAS